MQLAIASPCTEGWDRMTPASGGRHCASCDKVVVDFTRMTDGELAKWFAVRAGQRVCGHLRADQLQRPLLPIAPPAPRWQRWALAMLALAGTSERSSSQPLAWARNSTATQQIKPPPAKLIHVYDSELRQNVPNARVRIQIGKGKVRFAHTDARGYLLKKDGLAWKVAVTHPDYHDSPTYFIGADTKSVNGEYLVELTPKVNELAEAVVTGYQIPIIDLSGEVTWGTLVNAPTLTAKQIKEPIPAANQNFWQRLFSRKKAPSSVE